MEERALESADPINPQRLFFELSKRLPDNAILSSDSGLVGELVRPRREDPPRDDGVAVGQPGDDGAGRALCDRREVRASRSRGDRAGRRRGDADERPRRADHDRQVLAALVRSAPDRARPAQRRPQPGDLGAAGDGGRPALRRLAGHPRLPLRPLRRADRPEGDPRRRPRTRSGRPGTRRSRPTGPSSSRRSPTRRCRRCRRTSPSSRRRTSRSRSCGATPIGAR